MFCSRKSALFEALSHDWVLNCDGHLVEPEASASSLERTEPIVSTLRGRERSVSAHERRRALLFVRG